MIVCIIGLAGSGKSTVTKLFAKMGFRSVEMGDIMKGRMLAAGMALDKRNVREYSLATRKKYGMDVVAKFTVKALGKPKGDIAITGLRSTYELEYFRKKYKGLSVVAVMAPQLTRFRRLHARGKPDDPKTLSDFKWTEQRELQGYMKNKKELIHGLGRLVDRSDYFIYNTGTLADLRKNVKELIGTLENRK